MKISEIINKHFTRDSNLFLLIQIFIFIFVIPIFPPSWHRIMGTIFFSLIFFTAIFALDTWRRIMFILAIVAFVTEWITELTHMPILNYISLVINILFFQIIVIKLIIQVAKSKKADGGVILESINGYLMMGLMFTTWVAIAMIYDPAAFSFNTDNPTFMDFSYFTFVTMTTLGYGEITPILPFARSISILISTSGQIYIAVIIAMLVGKYAASQNT